MTLFPFDSIMFCNLNFYICPVISLSLFWCVASLSVCLYIYGSIFSLTDIRRHTTFTFSALYAYDSLYVGLCSRTDGLREASRTYICVCRDEWVCSGTSVFMITLGGHVVFLSSLSLSHCCLPVDSCGVQCYVFPSNACEERSFRVLCVHCWQALKYCTLKYVPHV